MPRVPSIDEYVTELMRDWPALTPEQLNTLHTLFNLGRRTGGRPVADPDRSGAA